MRFMICIGPTRTGSGRGSQPELIARVGKLMGQWPRPRVLVGAEASGPARRRAPPVLAAASAPSPGPFNASNELPAGFAILGWSRSRKRSEWASRSPT